MKKGIVSLKYKLLLWVLPLMILGMCLMGFVALSYINTPQGNLVAHSDVESVIEQQVNLFDLFSDTSVITGGAVYFVMGRVIPAETPAEAVNIANDPEIPIELLLTDVIMPGMNGYDLYI